MTSTWDMITALTALAGVIAGLIMIWRKIESENEHIRKQLSDHDEKIAVIITSKASASDLIKLSEFISKIEAEMLAHHLNATLHRTSDFEKRLDSLIDAVNAYQLENRADHKTITGMIDRLRDLKEKS